MTIVIASWLAVTPLTFAATVMALVRRDSSDLFEWGASLRASAFATLPGLLLFIELVWHAGLFYFFKTPGPAIYNYKGTLLCVLGIFVGPLCFIASYSCRPSGLPSARVGGLVFAHFSTWAMSSFTSLLFALSV